MIEEKEDYFEQTPEDKPKKVKPPKQPRLQPDDPRYYDREDGRWDHLKPSPYHRGPIIWFTVVAIVVAILIIMTYRYFFTPAVDEAVQYGYVEDIRKEGSFFPTYEGVILPYKELMDTVRPYEGDFTFSTNDQEIAIELKKKQGVGMPVKVEYQIYRHKFPWRGNTKVIVTKVDSVDPSTLLPPDRRPHYSAGGVKGAPAEPSDAQ